MTEYFSTSSSEVQNENRQLHKSILTLEKKIARAEKDLAVDLHVMNKQMRTLRENMEVHFRRELVQMDNNYQRQAFEELEDSKKSSLFANTKFKDELSLLGAGIANLGLRLGREKTDFKRTFQDIQRLRQKAKNLRRKVLDYRLQLNHQKALFSELIEESDNLASQRDNLTKEVFSRPEIAELEKGTVASETMYLYEDSQLEMWNARKEQLTAISICLEPVVRNGGDNMSIGTSGQEEESYILLDNEKYSKNPQTRMKSSFRFDEQAISTHSSLSDNKTQGEASIAILRSASANEREEADDEASNITQVLAQKMKLDPTLELALRPLIGMEGSLLASFGEVSTSANVMSWLVKQVLEIWRCTAIGDADMKSRSRESPKTLQPAAVSSLREDRGDIVEMPSDDSLLRTADVEASPGYDARSGSDNLHASAANRLSTDNSRLEQGSKLEELWFTAKPRATTALYLGSGPVGPPLLQAVPSSSLEVGKKHLKSVKPGRSSKGSHNTDAFSVPAEVISFHNKVTESLKGSYASSPSSRLSRDRAFSRAGMSPVVQQGAAYSVTTDENGYTDFTVSDPLTNFSPGASGRSVMAARRGNKKGLKASILPSLSRRSR